MFFLHLGILRDGSAQQQVLLVLEPPPHLVIGFRATDDNPQRPAGHVDLKGGLVPEAQDGVT